MSEMTKRVGRDINMMIANLGRPVGMGLALPDKAAEAIAVIAIAAMREPTEAMLVAWNRRRTLPSGVPHVWRERARYDWYAMHEAALGDGPRETKEAARIG